MLALTLAPVAFAAPANDNFANRATITGTGGTKSGSNVGATTESGEPLLADVHSTIWYEWEAPASGPAVFSGPQGYEACYDFPSMSVGVFTGDAVGALTPVARRSEVCEGKKVAFQATAGTVYKIQIGSWSGYGFNQGTRTFSWGLDTRPRADLAVTQSHSEPVEAGNNATYTVNITNRGPDASGSAEVSPAFYLDSLDMQPAAYELVSIPSWCSDDADAGLLYCTVGSLGNGETKTGDFVIKPSRPGTLTSRFGVAPFGANPNPWYDPVSSNNSSYVETPVGGIDPVDPGDEGGGLEVSKVTPPNNKKNVSPRANVKAEFSQPLDGETIHEGTFTLSLGRTDVDTVVTYDTYFDDDDILVSEAILNPDRRLKSGKTYTATVVGGPDGITDETGSETLQEDKVWKFRIR